MAKTLAELQTEHRAAMQRIDDLEARCKNEKRDYTNEEVDTLTEELANADSLLGEITKIKEAERREAALKTHRQFLAAPATEPVIERPRLQTNRDELQNASFRAYLRRGYQGMTPAQLRDLSQDSDAGGGYLNAPAAWSTKMIQGLDEGVFVRAQANVLPPLVGSDIQGFPVLSTDLDVIVHHGENYDISASGATLVIGKRELSPNLHSVFVNVSNKLMGISSFQVEQFVQSRMIWGLSNDLETQYLRGDGADVALGVFTASSDGINTDRDTATANAGKITADDLIDMIESVDQKYHAGAEIVMHQAVKAYLRKNLKDGAARYLWESFGNGSVVGGSAGQINGISVRISNRCPSTITTGSYVAALCNWKYYWILDHANVAIQRLVELNAMKNQTTFLARFYTDGAPVLSEAFARLKVS